MGGGTRTSRTIVMSASKYDVVIIGAGADIGRKLAVQPAEQGCHLSLSDVSEAGLKETAALVPKASVKVVSDTLDVSDREAMSHEGLEWALGINLWGVIYGTKAFLPHLKASGDGHIINISSLFGLCSQPTQSAYNTSKFAVRGFTESLRQELDLQPCGVSATCVHPGGIKTNIARASRANASIEQLTGKSHEEGVREFEKHFVTSPGKAAAIILAAVQKNKRRVLVGPDAKVLDFIVRLLPVTYQRLVVGQFRKTISAGQQAGAPANT